MLSEGYKTITALAVWGEHFERLNSVVKFGGQITELWGLNKKEPGQKCEPRTERSAYYCRKQSTGCQ